MKHDVLPPSPARPKPRAPYTKPRLQVHGSVRALTRGGSGNAQEASQGNRKRP